MATLLASASARAESPYSVEVPFAISVTAASVLGALTTTEIPLSKALWTSEILGELDDGLHGPRSSTPDLVSDLSLAATILLPPVGIASAGFDEDAARGALIYVETHAIALLLNSTVKRLVSRPRPYAYASDPRPENDDAFLSFYSGHASAAFAAATAGSILYAVRTSDPVALPILTGTAMALAASTAVLRARARMHFPSDILIGALAGTAIGAAVSLLQLAESPELGVAEGIAALGGIAAGALVAAILPFDSPIVSSVGGLGATF